MNRAEYSKAYNKSKQPLRDAIKRLKEQDPKRYAELQVRAQEELALPAPQKHSLHELAQTRETLLTDEQIKAKVAKLDAFIKQIRGNRRDYFISTKDAYGDTHLYFETLTDENEGDKVVRSRHPKFSERNEEIEKIEPCTCPLCVVDS